MKIVSMANTDVKQYFKSVSRPIDLTVILNALQHLYIGDGVSYIPLLGV
jgi:hypothetical protein